MNERRLAELRFTKLRQKLSDAELAAAFRALFSEGIHTIRKAIRLLLLEHSFRTSGDAAFSTAAILLGLYLQEPWSEGLAASLAAVGTVLVLFLVGWWLEIGVWWCRGLHKVLLGHHGERFPSELARVARDFQRRTERLLILGLVLYPVTAWGAAQLLEVSAGQALLAGILGAAFGWFFNWLLFIRLRGLSLERLIAAALGSSPPIIIRPTRNILVKRAFDGPFRLARYVLEAVLSVKLSSGSVYAAIQKLIVVPLALAVALGAVWLDAEVTLPIVMILFVGVILFTGAETGRFYLTHHEGRAQRVGAAQLELRGRRAAQSGGERHRPPMKGTGTDGDG